MIKNCCTSKVAYRLKTLPTFLGGIAPPINLPCTEVVGYGRGVYQEGRTILARAECRHTNHSQWRQVSLDATRALCLQCMLLWRLSALSSIRVHCDVARVHWSKWYHLGHMQICTLSQGNNHASTPPLCLCIRVYIFLSCFMSIIVPLCYLANLAIIK